MATLWQPCGNHVEPWLMMDESRTPTIRVADEADRVVALQMVFDRMEAKDQEAEVERLCKEIEQDKLVARGLIEACRDERIVGAIFSQLQAGKTALVWPPRLTLDEPSTTAERLMDATSEWLTSQPVRVAFVLLPHATDDKRLLRASQFEPLSELLYLGCEEKDFVDSIPTRSLEFQPYQDAPDDRFLKLIEATYIETLDCPAMNDVRPIEDVVAGYRSNGVVHPDHWLIVRHLAEDVGCLLLNDHVEHGNLELVYMGLVVSARGYGWGKEVVRHAQTLAKQSGRQRLVLAVDAANAPGLAMYRSVGFTVWDRRDVYARIF